MTYPGSEFVTRALEATDFKSPAVNGNIVEITGKVLDKKTTSCRVHVSAQNRTTGQPMFSTVFVMVNVIDGHKTPIQEQSLSDGTA
jgi:acyl-CoA hydrolase